MRSREFVCAAVVLAAVTGCSASTPQGRASIASQAHSRASAATSAVRSHAASATSAAAAQWSPPYIDHVAWVPDARGRSLHVFPTTSGRHTRQPGGQAAAWREVVAKMPSANTRSLKAQFDCHWTFARVAEPNKPSWNLETWRPVVSEKTMVDTRCNPGGAEE